MEPPKKPENIRVKETPSKKKLKELKADEKGNEKEKGNSNEKLSLDIDSTVEMWVKDGFEDTDPVDFHSAGKTGFFCKYVTKAKGGKPSRAIQGGVVIAFGEKWLVLQNQINRISWSVQLDNIEQFFVRPITHKAKSKD